MATLIATLQTMQHGMQQTMQQDRQHLHQDLQQSMQNDMSALQTNAKGHVSAAPRHGCNPSIHGRARNTGTTHGLRQGGRKDHVGGHETPGAGKQCP
jgi:hypothetical protein